MHFKNPIRIELVVVAFITDTFSFSNDGPNVAFKPLCQRDKLQDGSERNPDGKTIQCPLDIPTLDKAAALPIAAATRVTVLRQ